MEQDKKNAFDWSDLEDFSFDADRLAARRLFTPNKSHDAHIAVDRLRTEVLALFRQNRWKTLGICSPTPGCGSTSISANLACSTALLQDTRSVLLDCNLRYPNLAKLFQYKGERRAEDYFLAEMPVDKFFVATQPNLALGLNTEVVLNSSEVLQSSSAALAIQRTIRELQPDLLIFDLPPILTSDDVLGFLPNIDAVILVVACRRTTARDIRECERLLMGRTTFLGSVLNKAPRAWYQKEFI